MKQDITFHLIVLNQQGKPQFVLEPKQQARTGAELPAQNEATSIGEIIHRPPQHIGGTTLGQILEKEHMA